jgi:hypothetical protein
MIAHKRTPAWQVFGLGLATGLIASSILLCNQNDLPQREPVASHEDPVYDSPWETCGSDSDCERIGDELSEQERNARRQMLDNFAQEAL